MSARAALAGILIIVLGVGSIAAAGALYQRDHVATMETCQLLSASSTLANGTIVHGFAQVCQSNPAYQLAIFGVLMYLAGCGFLAASGGRRPEK